MKMVLMPDYTIICLCNKGYIQVHGFSSPRLNIFQLDPPADINDFEMCYGKHLEGMATEYALATDNVACFWCLLGRLDYHLPQHQKFSCVNFNSFDENDFASMYIFSIYFILQNLTTVGYGDRTGSTTKEYIFCMILEVSLKESVTGGVVYRIECFLLPDGQHQ